MKTKQLCLNVSKRNEKYLDDIEDYSLEFDLPIAGTVFRIVREYKKLKCIGEVL
jgi:hypothetical protein|tara:strand:- start:491 stop:652 length:162 start_codon:yes stop_codon:yes gene_type:complete